LGKAVEGAIGCACSSPALASMLGAKPPRHVPHWLARLLVGEHLIMLMTETRAGSNAKARGELLWQPAHASWLQGFVAVLGVAPDAE
jgi:hypothetical protein